MFYIHTKYETKAKKIILHEFVVGKLTKTL